MDNSFDKLNDQFTDKARGGFKYWFWLIFSYIFVVLGAVIGIIALLPGNNRYLSLLTLLCGAFGAQTNAWAKGTQARNKLCLSVSLQTWLWLCLPASFCTSFFPM